MGSISLEYHDEEWIQKIDYDHIPFKCRKFHEHGHLFQDYPLNAPPKIVFVEVGKPKEKFTQVHGTRRKRDKKYSTNQGKTPSTDNSSKFLSQTLKKTPTNEVPSHVRTCN